MPALEVLFAFAATTVIFAFIPGPAMLYAAARTLSGGRRAGLMAVLGIHIGAYGHIIAAAAGLSTLFHLVPWTYTLVKLAGAVYLVWLGVALFRVSRSDLEKQPMISPKSPRKAFAQSVAVEILNPKTAIFFLAFLPQFVDGTASFPVWAQLAILGTMVNAIFTSADTLCVMLASVIVNRLQRSGTVHKLLQRAGGTVLVGLGCHVALQRT
jgi:threonine/homoserine/homoserine lactone efflux protein